MILLMDNGSLEPASVLSLRRMAESLGQKMGEAVTPVSLLHSSTIPPEKLGGHAAEILEPALDRRLHSGMNDFLIVPAFFGPSGALTDYLPRRIAALKAKFPELRLRLAPPLVDINDHDDQRIAEVLDDRVRRAAASAPNLPSIHRDRLPSVTLVDHGSPVREVTAVRDHVARQLAAHLGEFADAVVASSMERRPGSDYAFSDPLLETVLDRSEFKAGLAIVAVLFLSPGRHAGPGGDIAQICSAATARHPQLHPVMTAPIGDHPAIIDILADRARAGLAAKPL